MKRSLPWVLLAVSLALNVFVVVGAVYTRQVATSLQGDPEARIAFLADRLSLAPKQVEDLKALRSRLQARRADMLPKFDKLRASIFDELAKDTFDRAAFLDTLESGRSVRQEFFAGVAEELHTYLATLSPEQKTAFIEMARKKRWFIRNLIRDRSRD